MQVSQFDSSFELLGSVAQKILTGLGAGNPACVVTGMVPCAKSTVNYWKNKFLSAGALRLKTPGIIKYYELTPFGSKLLTRSESGFVPEESFVLEDNAVKFGIVEDEKIRVDWCKLGQPRNWVKLGIRIGNVRVVKTSKSIIIHPGKLRGFDVDELEVTAGQIIERVRAFLEDRFGMILSEEGTPLHKPIYEVFTPEAEEWAKAGTVTVKGVGRLDKSPPERKAHREYDRKQLAINAVRAPLILERLERKVDGLTENILNLVSAVEKFSEIFGQFIAPPAEDKPESKFDKYVS